MAAEVCREKTGDEGAEELRGQDIRGVIRVPTEVSQSDGSNRVRGRCGKILCQCP